ncbi:hypothetical protein SAMN02745194_02247 [Roseomonas rosea]|uniref:EthD domain-containing protein n=1 Tax=Muricoccus roseus TaxID=198092 RepID=A0A1M6I799_9PROT|nr:hypothetical protein [Roseomonas rosea]SHJ30298.1 hypothetical protein SAMN02745194_02247 [Roseomonas rosea]
MTARGTAFLALWNDIERGREAEYDRWHTREHVPERVAAPGFRSGCRYVDRDHPVHRYFTLYELESLAALATPEYRDLLQHPTPWSAAMRPSFRNFLRAPCTVAHRAGFGRGASLAVMRLPGQPADGEAKGVLASLAEAPGVVALRLGRHEAQEPAPAWASSRAPDGPASFGSVLLIEALDRPSALRAFDAALTAFLPHGAAEIGGVYDLASIFPGEGARERLAHRRPGWDLAGDA